MKLIKRTYIETFQGLIPLLIIGCMFGFYMIKFIIYEETDEYLLYEMERIIEYHQNNHDLPEFHQLAGIHPNKILETPIFKDTLIFEERDQEMIPHRELHFSIRHYEQDFTLVLRQMLPGNDDIIEGTLLMMGGLFLLIIVFLLAMVNTISSRIWKPFHSTLVTIAGYSISDPLPTLEATSIDEFNLLNNSIHGLFKKISHDYQRTKEFNENAAHELHTHLAIIKVSAEKLLNSSANENNFRTGVKTILQATAKLSHAQKTLLLLSKIGNLEFNKNTRIDLLEIVHQSIDLFREAIDLRKISVELITSSCIVNMDVGLADLLMSNLIKNAVKHNVDEGFISVKLNHDLLTLENSGLPFEGDSKLLFERFTIGKNGNLGLGLAIIKQICDVYGFDIRYAIRENVHKIEISFPSR